LPGDKFGLVELNGLDEKARLLRSNLKGFGKNACSAAFSVSVSMSSAAFDVSGSGSGTHPNDKTNYQILNFFFMSSSLASVCAEFAPFLLKIKYKPSPCT
jgi:hypothetical protein